MIRSVVERLKRHPVQAGIDLVTLLVPIHLFRVLDDRILHSGMGYDEQFFFWGGWNISKGQIPYVDFFEFKPPMVFITHAFAVMLFGTKATTYRLFFGIAPLVSIVLLHVAL